MPKPLKFHQTLNQAPRSARHGKHRRACAPAHRHSFIGADYSAGGADAGDATAYTLYQPRAGWRTIYTSNASNTGTGPGLTSADLLKIYSSLFDPPKSPQELPYEGVRVGEIIAWRAWLVVDDHELRSLAHHYIWQPGATITGNINEFVDDDWFSINRIWGGVYAHRTRELTEEDTRDNQTIDWPKQEARMPSVWIDWDAANDTVEPAKYEIVNYLGLVIGSVKLWGEVVEHERGYRAQFAKVVSLDQAWGVVDLGRLRAKYLQR